MLSLFLILSFCQEHQFFHGITFLKSQKYQPQNRYLSVRCSICVNYVQVGTIFRRLNFHLLINWYKLCFSHFHQILSNKKGKMFFRFKIPNFYSWILPKLQSSILGIPNQYLSKLHLSQEKPGLRNQNPERIAWQFRRLRKQ